MNHLSPVPGANAMVTDTLGPLGLYNIIFSSILIKSPDLERVSSHPLCRRANLLTQRLNKPLLSPSFFSDDLNIHVVERTLLTYLWALLFRLLTITSIFDGDTDPVCLDRSHFHYRWQAPAIIATRSAPCTERVICIIIVMSLLYQPIFEYCIHINCTY